MNDLDFIKEYKKSKKVAELCKQEKIHYSNLINGKTTKEKEEKIAKLCKLEIVRLYKLLMEDVIINAKTNTL